MGYSILFATGNEGKMKEVRMILQDLGEELYSLRDIGTEMDAEENGSTFEENALIKARAAAQGFDGIVLADDSGLQIDYLNGEPGIYSARYMGEDTSYRVKNAKLLERMEGVPEEKRTARFVCVIAAVLPGGEELTAQGVLEGRVGYEERGGSGFGYDPIFYLPEYGCTSAELSLPKKNEISHRGKALREMRKLLLQRF